MRNSMRGDESVVPRGPLMPRGSRRAWRLTVALIVLATGATSAGAQERTLVLRNNESAFEVEVDRLVQELLQKRRIVVSIVGSVQQMQGSLRTVEFNDEQRAHIERSIRQLRERLTSLESDGVRIRNRLGEICDADRQPAGWVGIAYSVSANATRQDDGRVIMRFENHPSIESVEPGSPADKAGIRGGDRILAMAGRDLRDAEIDFTPLLKPGTRIPFRVQRGSESRVLTVTVEPRPSGFSTPCPWVDERIAAAFAPSQMMLTVTSEDPESPGATAPLGTRVIVQRGAPMVAVTPPVPPVPPVPPLPPVGVGGGASSVVFGGAQFIPVSAELSAALGVERGLLVIGTGRGSPAEQSGLRTGDVLVAVDGRPVASPQVFLQAVEESTRHQLRLQLVRRGKPVTAMLRW